MGAASKKGWLLNRGINRLPRTAWLLTDECRMGPVNLPGSGPALGVCMIPERSQRAPFVTGRVGHTRTVCPTPLSNRQEGGISNEASLLDKRSVIVGDRGRVDFTRQRNDPEFAASGRHE